MSTALSRRGNVSVCRNVANDKTMETESEECQELSQPLGELGIYCPFLDITSHDQLDHEETMT